MVISVKRLLGIRHLKQLNTISYYLGHFTVVGKHSRAAKIEVTLRPGNLVLKFTKFKTLLSKCLTGTFPMKNSTRRNIVTVKLGESQT